MKIIGRGTIIVLSVLVLGTAGVCFAIKKEPVKVPPAPTLSTPPPGCDKPATEFPDEFLANVNHANALPEGYVPPDLRPLYKLGFTPEMCLRTVAVPDLSFMIKAAKVDGLTLKVVSGFRSMARQTQILNQVKKIKGDKAYESVAIPGHSEHQLGLAVDISGASLKYSLPTKTFELSPEGKWLEANSYKYGFIESYPKGKESITGYIYEPWHYRYVGIEMAQKIRDSGLTIQEFLSLPSDKESK